MDRICFGIMIDLAADKRPIARKVIIQSNPTSMKLQKSTTPWVTSIPFIGLNIGGPNARRKIGYRIKNLKDERGLDCRAPSSPHLSSSAHRADCFMWCASSLSYFNLLTSNLDGLSRRLGRIKKSARSKTEALDRKRRRGRTRSLNRKRFEVKKESA
jgi:hypothetical protein